MPVEEIIFRVRKGSVRMEVRGRGDEFEKEFSGVNLVFPIMDRWMFRRVADYGRSLEVFADDALEECAILARAMDLEDDGVGEYAKVIHEYKAGVRG